MDGLIKDLRYAVRAVRRDLAFFGFAALIIGLGVGANTAVFSIMSPLLIKPLPFEEPERLVWVAGNRSGGMSSVTSRTSNLRDYRRLNRAFEQLTGYNAFFDYDSYNLVGSGDPERLVGVGVARDFLEVLGVQPLHGRNFSVDESLWGAPRVVILGHGFWSQRFAADPSLVGSVINLNGEPSEVIGVLPPTFDFASTFSPGTPVDFLLPFPISDETDRWGNTLSMIGRLRPGVTVAAAQADLDRVNEQLQAEDPERWGLRAAVSGLQEQVAGGFRSAMVLLAAASGAVMLIACANLSNLLLASSVQRSKEMAIRSVLGAGRLRLIRQLLTESLLMALSGAFIGVMIALSATRAVSRTTAVSIPMLQSVSVDLWALGFTLAVAVGAGVLLGIVPALQLSAGHEHAAINDSTRGSSESRRSSRLREALVVAEVALACVLLVGGGLLLRSFLTVLDVNLGFEPAGAVAWRVDTNRPFDDQASRVAFYEQLVDRVASLPGVESVGLTDTLPLGRNRGWGIAAEGVTYEDGEYPGAFPRMVGPGYVPAMAIPLLAGRQLSRNDTAETGRVVLINRSAAERLWPGEDAIGRNAVIAGDTWEVVGVVEDVRHQSLEQGSGNEMYLPMAQMSDWGSVDMVVRSTLPLETLAQSIRATLRAADPAMPTGEYESLDAVVDRSVSPRRFVLMLLGAFAGAALVLASLGIYGVLSYSVTQRTPEIGIRMALGEPASRVRRSVVTRTVLLAGSGILIGSVASAVVSRLIGSLLFGVGSADAATFAGMALILMLVSALAGYLPARKASRTDPMVALRSV